MDNSDRSLWEKLFQANREFNELRFTKLTEADELLAERISSVEDILVKHTKRSLSNSHHLYLLMGGVFVCFFLLGLSIEGKIAGSTISYSANRLTQIVLQVCSAGGVAVAIASNPKIKQIFRK